MNNKDAISFLAQCNGKSFCPLRDFEEAEEIGIPFFEVTKSVYGRCGYEIKYHRYDGHDNAVRMPYYCNYLLQNVFPNVKSEDGYDLTGYYPLELHDAITYLNNGKDYSNALTFAKVKDDAYPCLIPDPFMIGNYGGRLDVKDRFTWEQKRDRIGFFGVTTGDRDPSKNERLRLCQWSTYHRGFCDFYITGIVQMEQSDVVKTYSTDLERMMHPPVSQEEQYNYKYLLSMDGNTCSYDRLCWIMNSNSLAFKYKSRDMLWYYPLLMENTHYVGVSDHTLETKMTYYSNNPREAEFIRRNANSFTKTYANPTSAIMYLTYLFETVMMNKW